LILRIPAIFGLICCILLKVAVFGFDHADYYAFGFGYLGVFFG